MAFLHTILFELGFPDIFVTWIMACVTTVSYSPLINGKPCKPFFAKKGLRQGDPISPFLFAIGMEYLSRCLGTLHLNPSFKYHPRCARFQLTHMIFADDLLIICKADTTSVQLLIDVFHSFSKAPGLEANLHKSNLYLGGVTSHISNDIHLATQIPLGDFPFR